MTLQSARTSSFVSPDGAWRVLRGLALAAGVALWAAVFAAPLAGLCLVPASAPPGLTGFDAAGPSPATPNLWGDLGWSCLLAGAIATAAVVLGFLPGRLMGQAGARSQSRACQAALLTATLFPLLLPNYVLYYAWAILLAPQAWLGGLVAGNTKLALQADAFAGVATLVLWYWPLAALLLAQGWRSVDAGEIEQARLEAGPLARLTRVYLPLTAKAIAMAWSACFVLALGEFTTFHLSKVSTIGTQLAILLQQTGDVRTVARASLPVAIPAVLVAGLLWRGLLAERPEAAPTGAARRLPSWQRAFGAGLLAISCAAPIALLVGHLDVAPLRQFWKLHADELAYSFYVSALAAAISLAVAWVALEFGGMAAVVCRHAMSAGESLTRRKRQVRDLPPKTWRQTTAAMPPALAVAMQLVLLLTMLLPPTLLAGSLLSLVSGLGLYAVRDNLLIVSLGLAMRYAGLAMLVLHFARRGLARELTDLAAVDGANRWQAFWHVHLPHQWMTGCGAAILVIILGMTEIPATMLLLPAGVPCFAQTLLNQMHYARDAQVIASCAILVAAYFALAVAGVVGAVMLRSPRKAPGTER